MRQILILSVLLLLISGFVARFTDHALELRSAPRANAVQSADQPRQTSGGQHTVVLSDNRGGHFQVEARINGRTLGFLIDTGASLVVLRESAATTIQIFPKPSDYTARISTANGVTKAAPMTLDRVEIGDITVFDVRALVLPDEALAQNLLGVSFLSRLKRYEFADGHMVLEQ